MTSNLCLEDKNTPSFEVHRSTSIVISDVEFSGQRGRYGAYLRASDNAVITMENCIFNGEVSADATTNGFYLEMSTLTIDGQ